MKDITKSNSYLENLKKDKLIELLRKNKDYINVKDYGAIGDGIHDDTNSILKAVSICQRQNGSNGGTIFIPYGKYKITSPLDISMLGVCIKGESTQGTVLRIEDDFNGDCFININNDSYNYLGKITIENLKFDASNNNNIVHGIKFMPLIYNTIFMNLDFESFSGSWFFNESTNLISEGLKFDTIQGNSRKKIYKSPLIKIGRLNDSIFINCKLFGKQYHSYPYSKVPMLELNSPQHCSILSCNFSNSSGNAILINSTGASIQGNWIQGCHFEDIDEENSEVIKIIGDRKNNGEYGFIGNNYYLEIKLPTIIVDNIRCLEINDNKPSIKLGKGTISCIVKKTIDNNSSTMDCGINNIVIEYKHGCLRINGKECKGIL